jgi:primase-polymerase (primpol)-like protein
MASFQTAGKSIPQYEGVEQEREQDDCAGPPPVPLPVLAQNIPEALRHLPAWLVWSYTWKPPAGGKPGKWDKPPRSVRTGNVCDGTQGRNWSSLQDALAAYDRGNADGIGLALADDDIEDALVAVDLDHVRDASSGVIVDWAQEIVNRLASYTEVSPSGTGLRLLCYGRLVKDGARVGPVEVYRRKHYVTVTGQRLDGTPTTVERRPEALAWLVQRHIEGPRQRTSPPPGPAASSAPRAADLSDEELLGRAFRAKNGDRLKALLDGSAAGYGSDSEADLATCCLLAFWFGRDADRIERIVNASRRGDRPKWKERADYRRRTVAKALEGGGDVYDPAPRPRPGPEASNGAAPRPTSPAGKPYRHETDDGNAKRLVLEHGADLRHCHPWGKWLCWDGCRWRLDDSGEATRRAKRTLADLFTWTLAEMRKVQHKVEEAAHE